MGHIDIANMKQQPAKSKFDLKSEFVSD